MQFRFQGLFSIQRSCFRRALFKTEYLTCMLLVGKNRGFVNEIECNFAGESWRSMRYC